MFSIFSIIKWVKNNITARDYLLLLLLLVLFFATRVINLDKFPIFSDEGIYIHWAKVAWHDASWRFISLTDGKQPLQTWGTIPFLKLFSGNLLLGGRMFAVFTGLFALFGMFTTTYYLFGKRAAYFGSFLYILTPYFLFYDRMAMVDSGVNAFFIWIFFFSVWLARTERLDVALLFALIGGFGLLAKSSVRIFLGLSAFAPILFFQRNDKTFWKKTINFFILLGLVAVISLVIYNVQRLSPFFHYVSEKNGTFIKTLAEIKQNPFDIVPRNLLLVPQYVFWESGFIVSVFGLVGLFALIKKDKRLFLYGFLWLILPFIVVVFMSKVLFPRYIIFFPTLLVIFAAYLLSSIKNKNLLLTMMTVFIISISYFDYTIIADYKNIPLPPVDRGQYIEDWPAGWGIKEIVDYSREESKDKPVILLSEGSFGMAGDVLDSSLKPDDKIFIRSYWPLNEENLIENQKDLDKNYVFVVYSHKTKKEIDEIRHVKLIKQYDKPKKMFEEPGKVSSIFLMELTK